MRNLLKPFERRHGASPVPLAAQVPGTGLASPISMQSKVIRLPQRSALLAVNPHSARGGSTDLRPFVETLERANVAVDVVELGSTATLGNLLLAEARKVDAIIIAGGDGTVREAADALVRLDRPVGLLPLGTANDLARGLGIPVDPVEAAQVIIDGRTRLIDVGLANSAWFFNAAGIGLGPALTRRLEPAEKASLGVLAYLKALLRTVRTQPAFHAELEIDGQLMVLRLLQLTVVNGKYYGGGMAGRPDACLDDGMLEVIAIRAMAPWRLFGHAPILRRGPRKSTPQLYARRARRVRVITRQPMDVTTDGEITTRTPVTLIVKRGMLRVFVSPQSDAVRGEEGQPS